MDNMLFSSILKPSTEKKTKKNSLSLNPEGPLRHPCMASLFLLVSIMCSVSHYISGEAGKEEGNLLSIS